MKHHDALVDYWMMLKISFACLLLSISGYALLRMMHIIFFLPINLRNNQKRLEELAAKLNLDLDKEIADAQNIHYELEEYEKKNKQDNETNNESKANMNTNAKADTNITNDLSKEPKKIK